MNANHGLFSINETTHRRALKFRGHIMGAMLLLTFNAQASELDTILADQEQQILHLAEQKRQLKVLNSLLPSLQELTTYPQTAIELLIDHNLGRLSHKDKKMLTQVIQALREESSAQKSKLTTIDFLQPVQSNFGLTTLLATSSNSQSLGAVVFQLDSNRQPLVVNVGQSFEHIDDTYRLLDVQALGEGLDRQFQISLQTAKGIRQYRWPEQR